MSGGGHLMPTHGTFFARHACTWHGRTHYLLCCHTVLTCLCWGLPAQILGFPVQLVGLLALPYLGVRWFVDGKSAGQDIEEAVVSDIHAV